MARHGVLTSLFLISLVRAAAADEAPVTVASINLCTDQLVLALADPEQILSISWLAADAEESMLAERARAFPVNYGSAEEMLRIRPDVVIAGSLANAYTRGLLRDLGYTVVDIEPAVGIDDIARNLRRVGQAVAQNARAEALVERMRRERAAIEALAAPAPVDTVVVRPGGFTAERPSIADELLRLAGLANVTADEGLDRWGSLSMETVLRSRPELIVVTDYRAAEPSIANAVLEHPALAGVRATTPTVSIPARYWACGMPESLESARRLAEAARALVPGPDGRRDANAQ